MLSKNTLSIFCNLLMNLSEKERQVEIGRQVLCQNLNFDAYQVFSYIDRESKNYIDEINLMTLLNKKNKIPCTLEELQFLILLYDENFDSKLSYSEFLNIVLSNNNYELRKSARENICSNNDISNLPFNIEYSLIKLLQKELDLIRSTRMLIEKLKSRKDFNVHDLFHYVKGYGNITHESLKIFLEKNMILFDNNDLNNIIKRMDINNDSKIDFNEFHQILCFPKLKCDCCSFCQCNCLISNKNFFGDKNELNNEDYNYNYDYNNLIQITNNKQFQRNENFNSNNYIKHSFSNNDINELDHNNQLYSLNLCHNNIQNCCSLCVHNHIFNDIYNSENKFLYYIKKLIENETKIEEAKINLVKRPDFNIEDAFFIFSNPKKEIISFSDLQNGFKDLGLNLSEGEIKLIMNRADINKKSFLNFENFFDLLIPNTKKFRENCKNKFNERIYLKNHKSDIFLLSTKIYLINLIRLIIQCESELNLIKKDMVGINMHLKYIFNKIDKSGLGFISDYELLMYLQNCGINCSETEILLIFSKLDKNKNGKIEIFEIEEELKSPFL